KKGVIWGLMVSFIMATLDMIDMTFEDAFLSRKNLIRIFIMVVCGIFIVGYYSWKKKIKSEKLD
ncbi:MAG TPA: hypothetical protein DCM02_14470, partial [Flavobacterium sp.]|nr:hypothetical protein [Flavobacterium sp.]